MVGDPSHSRRLPARRVTTPSFAEPVRPRCGFPPFRIMPWVAGMAARGIGRHGVLLRHAKQRSLPPGKDLRRRAPASLCSLAPSVFSSAFSLASCALCLSSVFNALPCSTVSSPFFTRPSTICWLFSKLCCPSSTPVANAPTPARNTRRRPSPKSKSAMIPPLVTCGSKITPTRRITR